MPVSEATLSASPLEPAVALRDGLALGQQPLHRDVDVAELAGHAGRALHDPARLDDAAAEPGAHDRGDRRVPRGVGAEAGVVGVEGGRVAVVVVDDGQAAAGSRGRRGSRSPRQPSWAKFVDPIDEMTPSALAGPGVSRPDRAHALARRPGALQDVVEGLDERLDRDLRALR